MAEVILEAIGLVRRFPGPDGGILAVDGISLTVQAGEALAIVGPSGSGKSSLVHLLAGLDTPDAGTVRCAGADWTGLRSEERAGFRRRTCGFVPQGFSLLPAATAAENVEVPLLLEGVVATDRARRVSAALADVGLEAEARKLPDQLSGGQQQRVAIARALVLSPRVLIADEPTAALDSMNAATVTDLLVGLARRTGTAVVIVTHDLAVAAKADRRIRLVSGHQHPELAA